MQQLLISLLKNQETQKSLICHNLRYVLKVIPESWFAIT
jgi:hypothetical protein